MMFTQHHLQARSKRLLKVMAVIAAVHALLFAIAWFVVWPMSLSLPQRLLLILVMIFLVVSLSVISSVLHLTPWFAVYCPHCRANLSSRLQRVVRVKRCPLCDAHIYEGRPRSNDAFRRLMKIKEPCARKGFAWFMAGFAILQFLLAWPKVALWQDVLLSSLMTSFFLVLLWIPYSSNDDFKNECLTPMLISLAILAYSNTLILLGPNPWKL